MKSAKTKSTGKPVLSVVPWNTPALWRVATASLSAAIDRNTTAMAGIYSMANSVSQTLDEIKALRRKIEGAFILAIAGSCN